MIASERIDDDTPALGALQACRRAARTIFLGSATAVSAQNVRGIGVETVRLGCAQPGQSVGKYDDALRRLSDRLHYLYAGNERFWFDLRPNLRREMEDRLHRFDNQQHLYPEIEERLQKLVKTALCSAVHVFAAAKDIPDKPDLRLVVLDPDHGHKRKDESSPAIKAASAILARHGDKPREHQNRLPAQYGTEVTLTLDIEARRTEGFETKTVRIVKENAATLGFNTAEFEED